MRKLYRTEIVNGVKLQKIGEGQFSKVWLQPCGKKVLINSCCPVKASNAWAGNENKYLPLITRLDIDPVEKGDIDYHWYEMKYYPKKKSLKKNLDKVSWELYKFLKHIYETKFIHTIHDFANEVRKSNLHWKQKDCLYQIHDSALNYGGQLSFEFRRSNVAAHNGNLILLDLFFDTITKYKLERR